MGPLIDGRRLDRVAAPDGCQLAPWFVQPVVAALDMEVREIEKQNYRKSLK
jgi:hypothetical protein